MSKKLLQEATIRRFMKLANLNGNITSNFLKEMAPVYQHDDEELDDLGDLEGGEAALEDEMAGLEGEADELGDEMDDVGDELSGLEAEEDVDADQLVTDIVTDIQKLAAMAGVEVEIGDDLGDEEIDMDMDMDMDMDLGDEVGDLGGEEEDIVAETLRDMINSILAEEDGAMAGDEKKTSGRKRGSKKGDEAYINEEEEISDEDIDAWLKGGKKIKWADRVDSKQQKDDDDLAKLQARAKEEEEEESLGSKLRRRSADRRSQRGQSATGFGGRRESVQVLDDEKLIQEVAKRVKQRLARIARARAKSTKKRRR